MKTGRDAQHTADFSWQLRHREVVAPLNNENSYRHLFASDARGLFNWAISGHIEDGGLVKLCTGDDQALQLRRATPKELSVASKPQAKAFDGTVRLERCTVLAG